VRITYALKTSTTPVTVTHGGHGGVLLQSFKISGTEEIIAFFGKTLVNPGQFGKNNLVSISLVVANLATGVPITKVNTVDTNNPAQSKVFDLNIGVAGATSYTFQPPGEPRSYLQAFGFSADLAPVS